MKSFPAGFAAEKNKLTGLDPVWILKMTVSGVDYYLAGESFTVAGWMGGVTTKGWIASWGQIAEGLAGAIDEIRIADFSVDFLIDPDASPNMQDLAEAADLEESPAVLYLWFHGLSAATDPPQEYGRYHVTEPVEIGETGVTLGFTDETCRLEAHVGTKITRAAYPDADPDDVGKVLPIPYGSVPKLPALAVAAGIQTSLPNNINSSTTSVAVSDATGLQVGDVVQADDERMLIGAIAGDTLTVTRGHDATVPATHLKGAILWEVMDEFAYLAADCAVDSLPKVYGRVGEAEVDITAVASRYLGSGASALVGAGQVGGQHPSYPGKACVTVPGYITISQAVDLLLTDGLTVQDTIAVLDNLGILDALAINDGITVDDLLSILDGIGVSSALSVADTIGLSDGIAVTDGSHGHADAVQVTTVSPDTVAPNNANNYGLTAGNDPYDWVDANFGSYADLGGTSLYGDRTQKLTHNRAVGFSGTPTRARLCMHAHDYQGSGSVSASGKCCNTSLSVSHTSTTISTVKSTWGTIAAGKTWADLLDSAQTYINVINGTENYRIYEVWWEIEYDPSPPAAGSIVAKSGTVDKTGGAAIAGTQAARSGGVTRSNGVTRGGSITRSSGVSRTNGVTKGGGVARAGAITLSGNSTANTLVGDAVLCDVVRTLTVAQAFDDLLVRAGAWPALQTVGALPGGYALNGAITEYRRAIDWLTDWAFQLRSYFRMRNGTPTLIVRPDAPAPVKTISAVRTVDGRKILSRKKAAYSEVINKIDLLFDRDWSQSKSDAAYRGVSSDSDATSVDRHGERERPELFLCDFVASQAMADSVRSFYLARYKDRRWVIECDTRLYHAELEFGDDVTLGFLAGAVGTVQQARFAPGSVSTIDVLGLTVEV